VIKTGPLLHHRESSKKKGNVKKGWVAEDHECLFAGGSNDINTGKNMEKGRERREKSEMEAAWETE